MKLRILTLLLMYAIVIPLAVGQDQGRTRDGHWWISLPMVGSNAGINLLTKSWYITGIMDGAIGVANDLVIQAGIEALNEKAAEKARADYLRTIDRYFAGGKVTQGQIIDGLNAFYADFKNNNILVVHAIGVVLHQIAGHPQGMINSMTESLRRKAASR